MIKKLLSTLFKREKFNIEICRINELKIDQPSALIAIKFREWKVGSDTTPPYQQALILKFEPELTDGIVKFNENLRDYWVKDVKYGFEGWIERKLRCQILEVGEIENLNKDLEIVRSILGK